jgi:hypothetical protein
VGAFIGLFEGAFKCEGPVAIAVSQLSQQDLQNMTANQPLCKTEVFSYETGGGCENPNPFDKKNATYRVRYCTEKHTTPSAGGSATQYANLSRCVFLVGVVILLSAVFQ